MLMFRTTLLLLFLLSLPLRANLGETIPQCVVRYGKPVNFTEADPTKSPFGTLNFVAAGYALTVFILNNAEVGARVFKVDKSLFSPDEMQTIMGADNLGGPWDSVASTDPTCLQRSRRDGATVLYDKAKKMLLFTTPAMSKALHDAPEVPASGSTTNAAAPSLVSPVNANTYPGNTTAIPVGN